MPSFFNLIWACCLRSRSPSPITPITDETTRLIPSTHDQHRNVQPNITVIDHQKLKERLGVIVRSKGGKMINVGTPLPFNLHNKALHVPTDPSGSNHSSRVRSSSGSSGRGTMTAAAGPEGSTSRASSLHRPQSVQSTSPPHCTTSHPSPEEPDEGKRPIFNVRLANDAYARSRRGRTRGRLGRLGEERGREIYQRGSSCSNDRSKRMDSEEKGDGHLVEGKLSPFPPSSSASSECLPQNDIPFVQDHTLMIQGDFKIKDVGAIARSWRD